MWTLKSLSSTTCLALIFAANVQVYGAPTRIAAVVGPIMEAELARTTQEYDDLARKARFAGPYRFDATLRSALANPDTTMEARDVESVAISVHGTPARLAIVVDSGDFEDKKYYLPTFALAEQQNTYDVSW
eukprot:CFRG6465T1